MVEYFRGFLSQVLEQEPQLRVRRRVRRCGRRVTAWVPLRKSVAYLFRYREICLQSNARYLHALAQVDDPTPALGALDKITTRKPSPAPRPVKVFNPLARPESQLFAALMSGDHALHGFTNRDLRDKLAHTTLRLDEDPKKRSAQVSRLLHRLHVYALVAKIPRSRRWRVTAFGYRVMSAALSIRNREFPRLYADAA